MRTSSRPDAAYPPRPDTSRQRTLRARGRSRRAPAAANPPFRAAAVGVGMSVADFARMTAGRFKTADHPADAALDSLAELGVGLRARWHYLTSRPTGVTTCQHLGTTFEWRVESVADARRGLRADARRVRSVCRKPRSERPRPSAGGQPHDR